MKGIFNKVIGCIITVVVAICLIQYTGHILDPDWTQGGLDAVDAFHSIENEKLDVIVYGSSHAWKGCDTRVMSDMFGLSAYNYGCNWQTINTILLFLKDSLRTQTPKVVCIEVGRVNYIEQDVDLDGQIYYTRRIPNFKGKREYLQQCFGNDIERYASYYVPLMMFHDNWNQIDSENFSLPCPNSMVELRGYRPNTVVTPCVIPDYSTMTQLEIPEECMKCLDEIVKACNEKGVNIIFYTCPFAGEYNYSDAMERYAKENDCAYLDLFRHIDDMGLNGETDFQDAGHLNQSGSEKVATFLSEYIIENYDIK